MRSLTQSSAGIPVPQNPHILYSSSNAVPTSQLHPSDYQNTTITRRHPHLSLLHSRPGSFFNIDNDSPLLSARAKGYINLAIQNNWTKSTIKRYSVAIQQFLNFCESEQVPERLRFPADEFVLCAFAASSIKKHAGNTPRSRISALKVWHIVHNVEWKGSTRLRYVLKGVRNLALGRSKRPPRSPINAKMVSQLRKSRSQLSSRRSLRNYRILGRVSFK